MCGNAQKRRRPTTKLRYVMSQYLSAFAGLTGSSKQGNRMQSGSAADQIERTNMKTTMMKKQLGLAVTCALVLGFASGAARAQSTGGSSWGMAAADQRETWMESSRSMVWMNSYGECWHSSDGPPPSAAQCGP